MSNRVTLGLVVLLLTAAPASSTRLVVTRRSPALHVEAVRIEALVEDDVARTTLTLTFRNPFDEAGVAVRHVEIPPGAAVVGASLEEGGRRHEAVLVDRRTALRIEAGLGPRRDPVVVETAGPGEICIGVGPVPPRSEAAVSVSWVHRLPRRQGALVCTCERLVAAGVRRGRIDIRVLSKAPIEAIEAPDDFAVERRGSREARLAAGREDFPDSRLTVRIVAPEAAARYRPALGIRSNLGRLEAVVGRRIGLQGIALERVADGGLLDSGAQDVRAVLELSQSAGVLSTFTAWVAPAHLDDGTRRRFSRWGALDLALAQLASAQGEDGLWDGDPARTGLALRAFLSRGETHKTGSYRSVVKRGLMALRRAQDGSGRLAPEGRLLDHAWAAGALAEAYGLTGSPLFKQATQDAVDHLVRTQRPDGGWGDVAASVWCADVLAEAKLAGAIPVPEEALERTRRLLDRILESESDRGGFSWTTAAAAAVRIALGPPRSTALSRIVETDDWRPPGGSDPTEPLRWHFTSLLVRQTRGEPAARWRRAFFEVTSHRMDGGGWEPGGPLAERLGRIGTTALLARALAVFGWSGPHGIAWWR